MVLTGLDVLMQRQKDVLKGRKIGLVANPSDRQIKNIQVARHL